MTDFSIKEKFARYLEARRELEGGLYLQDETVKLLQEVFETLEAFGRRISGCQKCPLGKSRTNFVFGTGHSKAKMVMVGEAPGREEDLQGEPFVGRAGKLLDEILLSFGFRREEIYICNILKCRPPDNRDPSPEEITACEPYLWQQLELIKPRMIVALGRVAAQTMLKTTTPIGKMRTNTYLYQSIPFFVIYHPAAVLRNPGYRSAIDEDMKKIRAFYDGNPKI